MLQGNSRPLIDHGLPFVLFSFIPSLLCALLPGSRLGERLPGAAKAHGKYTSNRHRKACQSLAPGHRIVYSGRLYGHQPASWQWGFFVYLQHLKKILALSYFWFILNPPSHVLNSMGSAFPLWAIGMCGVQEVHTKCTSAAHPWARSSFCSWPSALSSAELKSSHGLRYSLW